MDKYFKGIRDNYLIIQGWMVTELELSGNELLLFALIYGFCQDNSSEFTGSINYVCSWLGCTRPTAIKTFNKLLDENLIIKTQTSINNIKFNKYKIDQEIFRFIGSKETLPLVNNFAEGSKEIILGGSKETLPNNTTKNNNTNNTLDLFKYFENQVLETTFNNYLQMRKKIKKPATEFAVKLAIKELEKLAPGNDEMKILIIEQSIFNSYQGLFPLKTNGNAIYKKSDGFKQSFIERADKNSY